MSTANDSLLYTLALAGFPVTDDVALGNTAQATGAPVVGDLARVVSSVANGAMMLKSSVSGEAPPICFVVNDSVNAIKVFPFVGESLNGTANTSLSIPSGQSGVFIRVPPQIAKGGGGGGTVDWRSAVIP